jgi:uncharacterized protein YndB with AHSA1/START domain
VSAPDDAVVCEVTVRAPAAAVYAMFTDPGRLVPGRRVVFTWGWESGALPVAPGASTVEVDLEERDGATRVRLTHRGLDEAMGAMHADGWPRYLARLAAALEGRDPGPDPAAAYAGSGPPSAPPEAQ